MIIAFAYSRVSCGISSASESTFLVYPSGVVVGLGTLLAVGDLSGVLPVDAEGRGGNERGKGSVGHGGDGEGSGGKGRDDSGLGGGSGGRGGGWGG